MNQPSMFRQCPGRGAVECSERPGERCECSGVDGHETSAHACLHCQGLFITDRSGEVLTDDSTRKPGPVV